MTTGNSVADYRVVRKECEFCLGLGEFYAYCRSVARAINGNCDRTIVEKFRDGGFVKTFDEIKKLYKELKEFGEVECPNCDGKGTIEKWI